MELVLLPRCCPALVVALILTTVSHISECASSDERQCESVLMTNCTAHIAKLKPSIASYKILYSSRDSLNDVCSDVQSVQKCIKDANVNCDSYDDGAVRRYINTFNYVCGKDVIDVYLNNTKCYGEKSHANRSLCTDDMGRSNGDECTKQRELSQCFNRAYTYHCGEAAANVMKNVLNLMDKNPCSGSSGRSGETKYAWYFAAVLIVITTRLRTTQIAIQ